MTVDIFQTPEGKKSSSIISFGRAVASRVLKKTVKTEQTEPLKVKVAVAPMMKSALACWELFYISNHNERSQVESVMKALGTRLPDPIMQTTFLLGLPEEVLAKFSADTSMLRGYLAKSESNYSDALHHFGEAQSEYLHVREDNLRGFSNASKHYAECAKALGLDNLAAAAMRSQMTDVEAVQFKKGR
jgi:hypothetical protein